jgi:hypothetical protein
MLMFGPKNAPAKQMQYLYLPPNKNGGSNGVVDGDLRKRRPSRFWVFTLTQFEGIPMADVFKVMQYWSVDKGSQAGLSVVRGGMAIHLNKSSMFAGQIKEGTCAELSVMVPAWVRFAENRVKNSLSSAEAEKGDERRGVRSNSVSSTTSSADKEGGAPSDNGVKVAVGGEGQEETSALGVVDVVVAEGKGEAAQNVVVPTPTEAQPESRLKRIGQYLSSYDGVILLLGGVLVVVLLIQWSWNRALHVKITTLQGRLDDFEAHQLVNDGTSVSGMQGLQREVLQALQSQREESNRMWAEREQRIEQKIERSIEQRFIDVSGAVEEMSSVSDNDSGNDSGSDSGSDLGSNTRREG